MCGNCCMPGKAEWIGRRIMKGPASSRWRSSPFPPSRNSSAVRG
jgi:hypothetical protein